MRLLSIIVGNIEVLTNEYINDQPIHVKIGNELLCFVSLLISKIMFVKFHEDDTFGKYKNTSELVGTSHSYIY